MSLRFISPVAYSNAGGRVSRIRKLLGLWGTMTMMIGTAVEMADPLVPSFGILGYFLVVNAVLFLGALISIARTRDHTTGSQVVWALIVFALPVIGALTWFLIGRRAKNTAALKQ
jgi:hypothetical protein